ncbi:MAG: NADPH-dependent FMN reductase [Cellvibrionaceae bacterium]
MNIVIIAGSQRPQSQSAKLAAEMQTRLRSEHHCDIIDLGERALPFLDFNPSDDDKLYLDQLSATLSASDALVVIAPEWHGMAPAALKNFFLHFSGGQLAHKPALLVSVSSGDGGAYPIAELRSSSYKNSRICYLPEHLIVRHVESVFNKDSSQNNEQSQQYLSSRLDYALSLLAIYGENFSAIRAALPDGSEFANGM